MKKLLLLGSLSILSLPLVGVVSCNNTHDALEDYDKVDTKHLQIFYNENSLGKIVVDGAGYGSLYDLDKRVREELSTVPSDVKIILDSIPSHDIFMQVQIINNPDLQHRLLNIQMSVANKYVDEVIADQDLMDRIWAYYQPSRQLSVGEKTEFMRDVVSGFDNVTIIQNGIQLTMDHGSITRVVVDGTKFYSFGQIIDTIGGPFVGIIQWDWFDVKQNWLEFLQVMTITDNDVLSRVLDERIEAMQTVSPEQMGIIISFDIKEYAESRNGGPRTSEMS